MVFGSMKEINRLISKGMSNFFLKVTVDVLKTLKFKEFISRSVFGELQLRETSLNFKNSFCNLKIRGLEENLSVTFL